MEGNYCGGVTILYVENVPAMGQERLNDFKGGGRDATNF